MRTSRGERLAWILAGMTAFAPPAAAAPQAVKLQDGARLYYQVVSPGSRVRPFVAPGLRTVLAIAREARADLAINGGYFNHQDGVSASYVIAAGRIRTDPHANALLVGNPALAPYLEQIFDRSELRVLREGDRERWQIARHSAPIPPQTSLLASLQAGPRLLPTLDLEPEAFVARKHGRIVRDPLGAFSPLPRSALGLRADGSLVLVAVTGSARTGLSLEGLAEQLRRLGCDEAMALDGGSSVSLAYREGGTLRVVAPQARVKSALVVRLQP